MKTTIEILSFLKVIFVDSLNKFNSPILVSIRNIFSWIGLILLVNLGYITFYSKPIEVEQHEQVIGTLESQINENKKTLSQLKTEKLKLEKEIVDLRRDLDISKNKTEKYRKQYERQMDYINSLSDGELTKLFTKEFGKK
jgi:septal ring factor EnvC (AmiA/AmiB activator)